MCGVAGIITNKSGLDSKIHRMVSKLSHRGPDNSDTYIFNNLALGHTRLSIIDLNERSNQPLHDISGDYTIVFNGEIYNYKILKKELINVGVSFKTESDTEVVLNGYIQHGIEFFKKLKGFYAIAIFDKKNNSLLLTRDSVGKKPLYYCHLESEFIFSSELNPLISVLSSTPSVNLNGLSHYLWKGYYVDYHSAYKNVFQIIPGEFIIVNMDNLSLKKIESNTTLRIKSAEKKQINAINTVEESLVKSISRRFISDVPVSILLSGGVDSSLITILAKKYTTSDFETFYLGYQSGFDQFKKIAQEITSTLSIKHNYVLMQQPTIEDSVKQMVNIFNEPFADYSALPSYQMYREISKYSKVVLSGDGADEVFYGYEDAKKFLILFYIKKIYSLDSSKNRDLINKFLNEGYLKKIYAYFLTYFYLDENSFSTALYNGGWNNYYRKEYMTNEGYESTGKNSIEISEMQRFSNSGHTLIEKYANYYFVRLTYDFMVKVDRTSMANSLEVRSPYLDRTMINDLNNLDYQKNLSLTKTKKILKDLLIKHNFKDITKIKKQGFTPPLREWMKSNEGVKTLKLTLNKKNEYLGEFFKLHKLEELFTSEKQLDSNYFRLWNIMILSEWMKSNY